MAQKPAKPKHRTTGGVLLGSDYDTERTRKMAAEASVAEIQLAKLKGDLVTSKDVISAWQATLHACRAKLLSIPTKASPLVVNASDVAEVKALLDQMVNEALEELSNYKPEVDPANTAANQPEPEEKKPKKRGRPKKIDAVRES